MNIPESKRWLAYARTDLDAAHALLRDPNLYALSVWAVEARYPGDLPEVVEVDAHDALQTAEAAY